MARRKSSTTEEILSLVNLEIDKLEISGNISSTDTATITNTGNISSGIEPPEHFGNNEGTFIGFDNGPQISFYSNEENFFQWDGSKLLIQAKNFILDEMGNITANNAFLSGSIIAQSGSIAGWIIRDDVLYSGSGSVTVILDSSGSHPSISAGSSVSDTAPFRVYPDGRLYASDADISGSITATSGCFGGWSLSASSLHSGSANTYVALDSGGINPSISAGDETVANAPFKVYADGRLYASNADISGSITATSGCFGGWSLSASSLNAGSGSTTVGLDSGGINPAIYAGASASTADSSPFRVYNDGRLFASNADINGSVIATSGCIGGNKLSASSISSLDYISGNLGKGWAITSDGTAEFQNILARGMIRTSVFEKDTISSINGMVLISKSDILTVDIGTADADTTMVVSGSGTTFVANEVLRIKDGTDDEWMLVTDASSAPSYVVTRDISSNYGTDANPSWKTGTAVVSMGVGDGDKTGFVMMDASSASSPFIDVYGRNSTTYNDYTLHGRYGYLKAIIDAEVGLSNTDVWGLYTDNAYIKGSIVANTGYIGGANGWTITAGKFYGGNVTGSYSGMIQGAGSALSFFAGAVDSSGSNALFYVTAQGDLYAQSATLTGAIYATSGCIVGTLNMLGEQSSIAIGATPPTSSTEGTGIWIDRTGMYGLNSGVQQAVLDATTGKITAAGGLMYIDNEGITGDTMLKWMIRQSATFGTPPTTRTYQIGMEDYEGIPSLGIEYFDPDYYGTSELVNGDAETGDFTGGWTKTTETRGTWISASTPSVVYEGNYSFGFVPNNLYDTNAYVILNFDGSGSSTIFLDDATKTSAPWIGYGGAKLDASVKKSGTASLYLDGDSYVSASAIPAACNYISGDEYPWEDINLWIYINSFPGGGEPAEYIFSQSSFSASTVRKSLKVSNGSSGSCNITYGVYYQAFKDGGLLPDETIAIGLKEVYTTSFPSNSWHHISCRRISENIVTYSPYTVTKKVTLQMYQDGSLINSTIVSERSPAYDIQDLGSSTDRLSIGALGTASGSRANCYIDNFILGRSTTSGSADYPLGYVEGTLTSGSADVVEDTAYIISLYKKGGDGMESSAVNVYAHWYNSSGSIISSELIGSEAAFSAFSLIQKLTTSPAGADTMKVSITTSYTPNSASAQTIPVGVYLDNISVSLQSQDFVYQKLLFTDTGIKSIAGLYPTSAGIMADEGITYDSNGNRGILTRTTRTDQPYGFTAGVGAVTTSATNGYTYEYNVLLDSGIYDLELLYYAGTFGAIMAIYFDNVMILPNISTYYSAPSYNFSKVLRGIVSTYSGKHTLKIVTNSKNASSTGYGLYMTRFVFLKKSEYYKRAITKTFTGTCTDAYLSSVAPTTNYGDSTSLNIGRSTSGSPYRTLMRWDEMSNGTDIPLTASILSATLKLTSYRNIATENKYFYLWTLRRNWVESQATWNIYKTGSNWGTAGAASVTTDVYNDAQSPVYFRYDFDLNGVTTQHHFDVKTLTTNFLTGVYPNYGFLITSGSTFSESNDFVGFSSSASAVDKPILEVIYTEA